MNTQERNGRNPGPTLSLLRILTIQLRASLAAREAGIQFRCEPLAVKAYR